MKNWIQFWMWVYIVGLSLFGLLFLSIIPLGLRDLFRLFRDLRGRLE